MQRVSAVQPLSDFITKMHKRNSTKTDRGPQLAVLSNNVYCLKGDSVYDFCMKWNETVVLMAELYHN